jgi:undecaprenyl diphosphate synthase
MNLPSEFNNALQSVETPKHVAIIMDGNGRWAQSRGLMRTVGHAKGVDALREVIRTADDIGIRYLTVFAFSTENWHRPKTEVGFLMGLFRAVLFSEIQFMQKHHVRLKVVGDVTAFDKDLQKIIKDSQQVTETNTGLVLTICVNYSGRWDIVQATQKLVSAKQTTVQEQDIAAKLAMAYAPEPDLLIRTGGEMRLSNFLLWSLAYTELYFSDLNWPDFDAQALRDAVGIYRSRDRRFGQLSNHAIKPALAAA